VRYQHPVKRAFDLSSLVVALLFSAVLALLWLLFSARVGKLTFFRQERPGWRSRPFPVLKFRTMTDARDASGNLLPDAERLAAFGCWLRRASLDELPEFFNVLKGDMSLVGPRPLLMEYLPRYTPEQARRHEVRPVAGRRIFGRRSEVSRVARLKILIRPSHHPDR